MLAVPDKRSTHVVPFVPNVLSIFRATFAAGIVAEPPDWFSTLLAIVV